MMLLCIDSCPLFLGHSHAKAGLLFSTGDTPIASSKRDITLDRSKPSHLMLFEIGNTSRARARNFSLS